MNPAMDILNVANFIAYSWVVGLAASVFSLIGLLFMKQRMQRDPYGFANELAWMAALYFSLALFCLGLSVTTFSSSAALSIWIGNIWLSLALLLFIRAISTLVNGIRHGWHDDPSDPGRQSGISIWASTVAVLLSINLGLLLWAGFSQVSATTEPPAPQTAVETPSEVAQPGEEISAQIKVSPTVASEMVEKTAVITVTTTPTEAVPAETSIELLLMPTPTPERSEDRSSQAVTGALSGVVIAELGVSARQQPASTADVLATFYRGTPLLITGRTEDDAWLRLALEDDRSAWVEASLVQLEGSLNALPIENGGGQ